MESGAAQVFPVGRHLALDEQGVGLRLTWRLESGFVNLSLWRDDRCVETFHLEPSAAADVVSFLVRGLADVSSVATASVHRLREAAPPPRLAQVRADVSAVADGMRRRLSDGLAAAAHRIRPSS